MPSLSAAVTPAIFVLGWLLATLALRGRARRLGLPPAVFANLSWNAALGALIGARLLYVLQHASLFIAYPQDVVLTFWHGLSFFGGLAGAVIAGALYVRSIHRPFLVTADVVAPALPLGVAFVRLAFLGYYGAVGAGLPSAASVDLAIELLEALLCLGLFVTVSYPPRPGGASPFLLALGGYGLVRAILDLWRPGAFGFDGATDQSLALMLTVVALAILLLRKKTAAVTIGEAEGPGPENPLRAAARPPRIKLEE